MRFQMKRVVTVLGLLVFAAVLGSFAPVGAQRGPQFDFTPVAYAYLPLVESSYALDTDTATPTPTLTPTSTFTPTPTTTPTSTSTSTPTSTSTAYPAPPTLIAPSSGAVLTQPIGLNEWLFHWNARTGPCHSSFSANGPNGYSIDGQVYYQNSSPGPYSYHYTRTEPFPAEALGLWTWQATVLCPLGSAQSETRTFYLQGDISTSTPP